MTLETIIRLPSHQLAVLDIAEVNLICAKGLKGSEGIEIPKVLARLDEMATRIRVETDRNMHLFHEKPGDFQNSEAYFRMLLVGTVLYEDFGIRYNPARISQPDKFESSEKFYANSKDVFIHGLTASPGMGTCSSMPVLVVALGHRLKYPLSLVSTKAHLFVRWQNEKETLNFEATSKGIISEDDAHYREWPYPVSDEDIKADNYLKSMTPSEELACFLSIRAACMMTGGRPPGAVANLREATRIAPHLRNYRRMLETYEAAAEIWAGEQRMKQMEQIEQLLDNEGNTRVAPLRRAPVK